MVLFIIYFLQSDYQHSSRWGQSKMVLEPLTMEFIAITGGEIQIYNFNIANSPLMDNNILDISN